MLTSWIRRVIDDYGRWCYNPGRGSKVDNFRVPCILNRKNTYMVKMISFRLNYGNGANFNMFVKC